MNADTQDLHDALIEEASAAAGENRALRAHLFSCVRSYCQTREAVEAIAAAPNASYSIAGRSFTKANLADLKKHLLNLEQALERFLPSISIIAQNNGPTFHGVRF